MSTPAQPGAGREELRETMCRALWASQHGHRCQWSAALDIAQIKGGLMTAARIADVRDGVDALLVTPELAKLLAVETEIAALIAERDALKGELAAERARAEQIQDRVDDQSKALQRIVQWSDAYPTDIFTPPDYPEIHKTLTANGFIPGHTLDGISADCMRRATEGMGKIARAALAPQDTPASDGETDARQS